MSGPRLCSIFDVQPSSLLNLQHPGSSPLHFRLAAIVSARSPKVIFDLGCLDVEGFDGTHFLFIRAGLEPFEVITNAMPDVLNWLGWCIWDAFYTRADPEGVKHGLQSLEKGAIPTKFGFYNLIIMDVKQLGLMRT
ncbi:hypothetical protein K1719_023081 [Acacia pycnantha]|nr:hypothetical protein K1719_023081 [Acacia pycnantha]